MAVQQPARRTVLPPIVGGFGIGSILILIAIIISVLVLLGAISDSGEKLEWVAILLVALGIVL